MRKRKKIISDIDDIAKLLCTRRNFDKKEFRKIIYSEK